jgi:hypothetical protein
MSAGDRAADETRREDERGSQPDPTDTEHPAGDEHAQDNEENESPS